MAGEKILIADDDEDIREIVKLYLENEGYQVVLAECGDEAVEKATKESPDLIILDIMMPGLDGIEVCQHLRKYISVPIIFLSSKCTPEDKSVGLIAGGDDYISKPFESIELIARIKAHLRRNRMLDNSFPPTVNNQINNIINYRDLNINLDNYTVNINGNEIALTFKEFKILVLLAQNPEKAINNEDMYRSVWNNDSLGDYRTLHVHISNIRKKIEPYLDNPEIIQTVKGVGYKFAYLNEYENE